MLLQASPGPLSLEVFDSQGHPVMRDLSSKSLTQIRFKPNKGESYFLVVRPGEETAIDAEQKLRFLSGGFPR